MWVSVLFSKKIFTQTSQELSFTTIQLCVANTQQHIALKSIEMATSEKTSKFKHVKNIVENAFQDIWLRTQKEILSCKMIFMPLVDAHVASLLNNIQRLAELHTGNKKIAERLIKNMIKISIDMYFLTQKDQFNAELQIFEYNLIESEVQKAIIKTCPRQVWIAHKGWVQGVLRKLHLVADTKQNAEMAVITFYGVDFSFDLLCLQQLLDKLRPPLRNILERYLNGESLNRIDKVFTFINEPKLLERCFRADSPYQEVIIAIFEDLNSIILNYDTGNLDKNQKPLKIIFDHIET